MADIFVSYTSKDRDWAEWIGQQLESNGHSVHLDAWEISAGGNIAAWMEERHDNADHILCVMSNRYLQGAFSAQERHGALWAAASKRPNFLVPVLIEPCEVPTLVAPHRGCELYGLKENEAQARLRDLFKPATKPAGRVPFPPSSQSPKEQAEFPGKSQALSNIPIAVPLHFLGREKNVVSIAAALKGISGRAVITAALHGLRGVGKTTLAAAYADQHRSHYRATWWIRAETDSTMRADLVGLGVRLEWVSAEEKEEPALTTVLDKLRDEGDRILLIFDNANSPNEIREYLPRGGATRIIVTSNAPNWGALAVPVEIEVWPSLIGADFLIARTGRQTERDAAVALSEALGGLPLAHEQAAAYCERIGVSFAEYRKRLELTPEVLLDSASDAVGEYRGGLSVARTFALAIDEATKRHPAAETLITYAALLAPEPIPLFLFSEGREEFSEQFSRLIKNDGLDEAVAALRAFALIDRELIPDERDSTISTDSIRLHRLVRQVIAARLDMGVQVQIHGALIEALAQVYPENSFHDPTAWLRSRRLDAIAASLVDETVPYAVKTENARATILERLAAYKVGALADYTAARPLLERALEIAERLHGRDHINTTPILNNLGILLRRLGDNSGARSYYERELEIVKRVRGPDHPDTAGSLNNLAVLLEDQGDAAEAMRCHQRALAIREDVLGPVDAETAASLHNIGALLTSQKQLAEAWPYAERALTIREKVLGLAHPDTAASLDQVGSLLFLKGELTKSRSYLERALTINERALGPEHPDTKFVARKVALVLDKLRLPSEADAVRQRIKLLDENK